MARDSNGVYSLPPVYLAKTGDTILATQHNVPLEDIANALTGSLPRNGSAPMVANLAMSGQKITGLANGTSSGDAVNKAQLDAVAENALNGEQTLTNKTLTSPKINNPVVAGADPWAFLPIGLPVPLLDNLAGVAAPPKDKAYRYILLTAGQTGAGAYNEGILTGESVTGSAPLVNATATINLAGSPVHGLAVNLINTERRFLRAGSAGTVENDQLQSHTHGIGITEATFQSGTATRERVRNDDERQSTSSGTLGRFGNETRPKNIGVTYYMRIK